MKDEHLRYLSQSVRLKEQGNPAIVRGTTFIVSVAILAFIGWSAAASVHEIARTPGEIVPSGYTQVVQHLEGGIVRDIPVKEGGAVEKDQVVLRLDGTELKADLDRALSKKEVLALQEERLRAFAEGRAPAFDARAAARPELMRDSEAFFASMKDARDKESAIIEDQIRQKRQSISVLGAELRAAQSNYDLADKLYQKRVALNREGVLSDVKLLETEQRRNELAGQMGSLRSQIAMAQSALKEYETRLSGLAAGQKDEANQKLDAIVAERLQNDELIEKLKGRIARLDIRAPTGGIVKGLAVNTVGSVVAPGQVLMEIVPTGENLVVSLKIPPRYIGHIKPGQDVQVKFSSYDFARYGAVRGTLQSLSATTFEGENGERFYQGKVALSQTHVGQNTKDRIIPGMTVMADIVTGEKTILQYLLKPVQAAMSTAFTER